MRFNTTQEAIDYLYKYRVGCADGKEQEVEVLIGGLKPQPRGSPTSTTASLLDKPPQPEEEGGLRLSLLIEEDEDDSVSSAISRTLEEVSKKEATLGDKSHTTGRGQRLNSDDPMAKAGGVYSDIKMEDMVCSSLTPNQREEAQRQINYYKEQHHEDIDFALKGDDRGSFLRRLKSIMIDNLTKKPNRGTRWGDVCHKALYRIKYSDRIFQKPLLRQDRSYYIVLVVDVSGSMNDGCKSLFAAMSTAALVQDLSSVAKVKVIMFNEQITVIKTFDQLVTDKLVKEIGKQVWAEARTPRGAYNYDETALLYAEKSVNSLESHNKVIIILSDGQPSFGYGQNIDTLKNTIERIDRSVCPIISIGIQSDYVKKLYTRNVYVLNSPQELYQIILRGLSGVIKRMR